MGSRRVMPATTELLHSDEPRNGPSSLRDSVATSTIPRVSLPATKCNCRIAETTLAQDQTRLDHTVGIAR